MVENIQVWIEGWQKIPQMLFKEGYSLWCGFSGHVLTKKAHFATMRINFNNFESLLTELVFEPDAAINQRFNESPLCGGVAGDSLLL